MCYTAGSRIPGVRSFCCGWNIWKRCIFRRTTPPHPLLSLHSETSSRFLLLLPRLSLYLTTLPTSTSLLPRFFPHFPSRGRHEQYLKNTATVHGAPRGWIYAPARFSFRFPPWKKKFEDRGRKCFVNVCKGTFIYEFMRADCLWIFEMIFREWMEYRILLPRFVMFTVAHVLVWKNYRCFFFWIIDCWKREFGKG